MEGAINVLLVEDDTIFPQRVVQALQLRLAFCRRKRLTRWTLCHRTQRQQVKYGKLYSLENPGIHIFTILITTLHNYSFSTLG